MQPILATNAGVCPSPYGDAEIPVLTRKERVLGLGSLGRPKAHGQKWATPEGENHVAWGPGVRATKALERKLRRELDIARSSSAEERVLRRDIGSDSDREYPRSPPRRLIDRPIPGDIEAGQQRIGEIAMVEDIEEIYSEPYANPLSYLCVLRKGKIEVAEMGSIETVAGRAAKMSSGEAALFWIVGSRAGNGECAQVEEVRRVVGSNDRLGDQVGTFVKLSGIVEVLVIHYGERHPCGKRDNSAQCPAVGQPLHFGTTRDLVIPEPTEVLTLIESGITPIVADIEAVIGLSLEWSVILTITRSVDRMTIRVVNGGSETVDVPQLQAGL